MTRQHLFGCVPIALLLAILAVAAHAQASHTAAAPQALSGTQANSTAAVAQNPVVTHADLPPSAIYTETLAPAEAVHADIANWSDTEIAAYSAAMFSAKAECVRLEQTPHEGEEALALARLCSLGQDWNRTYSAARWYTRASAPASEALHLPQGFGLLLQADLTVPIVRRAVADLTEMSQRLPLTQETDSIFNYAIRGLEVTQPEAGLEAAMLRQPALLEIVGGSAGAPPAVTAGMAEAELWHTLAQLHGAHRDADEKRQKDSLLAALAQRPAPLSAAETYVAERSRNQYEWLDKPMPEFHVLRSTYTARNSVQHSNSSVQLVIFEKEDAAGLAALAAGVDALRSRLQPSTQAILVVTPASTATLHAQVGKPAVLHAVYTDESLLERFGSSNGPLFLIVDAKGSIAFLGVGTTSWLNPQMQAEVLLDRALDASKSTLQPVAQKVK